MGGCVLGFSRVAPSHGHGMIVLRFPQKAIILDGLIVLVDVPFFDRGFCILLFCQS